MKNRKQQVLVAAALTGAVSMIYELVWVRYLGLVLGNSVYAAGTVTACYMAGVALGDFILGSWTVRHYKKVRTITFAGLAFCCLLSPVIYKAICGLNQAGAGVFGAVGGGIIWRALVSFLALLFPTALIGGILPVLIGGAAAEDGKVYAVNTLGSVAGAVFTGFFLIPEAGLSGSMAAAAGLLACSWILVRNLEPEACVEREIVKEETPYSQKEHRLALAVYGISGFTGMAFQIYQTKMLTLFFMDSVYDFAVILAVYIAGLFLGNLISSVWAKRTSKHMEILAGSQILLGICSVFSLYLVSRFPIWSAVFLIGQTGWHLKICCMSSSAIDFLPLGFCGKSGLLRCFFCFRQCSGEWLILWSVGSAEENEEKMAAGLGSFWAGTPFVQRPAHSLRHFV